MRFDVVGFAAINEDRIKHVNHNVQSSETFSLESPGELSSEERAFLGGSVINTLAGLAKLNFNVATIGTLGNDPTGERQKERLKKYGIEFFGDIVKGGRSSVAKIIVGRNKERSIKIHSGVNDLFGVTTVQDYRDLVYNCGLFHSSTFACAFDHYDSLQSQIEFAKMAQKYSLSFGMLYCDIFENRRPDLIKDLLYNTDILILNEDEIKRLTRESDYRNAASKIMDVYGTDVMAVTLGERGAHVFGKSEDYFVRAYKVKVVDLTGAGDAFTAGFLSGYLRKKDLRTCGELGNLNATNCIQIEGAVDYEPLLKLS